MTLREKTAKAIRKATYARAGANYPTESDEQAGAAIAAFREALLSPEAVEAAMTQRFGPHSWKRICAKDVDQANLFRQDWREALTAALAAVTEGAQGDE